MSSAPSFLCADQQEMRKYRQETQRQEHKSELSNALQKEQHWFFQDPADCKGRHQRGNNRARGQAPLLPSPALLTGQ